MLGSDESALSELTRHCQLGFAITYNPHRMYDEGLGSFLEDADDGERILIDRDAMMATGTIWHFRAELSTLRMVCILAPTLAQAVAEALRQAHSV